MLFWTRCAENSLMNVVFKIIKKEIQTLLQSIYWTNPKILLHYILAKKVNFLISKLFNPSLSLSFKL